MQCTLRLWKGGSHGDGTKITGPNNMSSLFLCARVPVDGVFNLSVERRPLTIVGKAWEHKVCEGWRGRGRLLLLWPAATVRASASGSYPAWRLFWADAH